MMAELKDLHMITKNLSLLYIDENTKFLFNITDALKQIFLRVDETENSTIALSHLKVHKYDIIIADSISTITNAENLIANIREENEFQEIILTTPITDKSELLKLYALNPQHLIQKPFKISELLDVILKISKKMLYQRNYLEKNLQKLKEDTLSDRKLIGRFMLHEKQLQDQIEIYKDTIHLSKNIYQLTKLPSKFALQDALSEGKKSIIYINIDHFDFVNSTYGMGMANKLLKECAKKLTLFAAINATLFHITADEFVILLDKPSENQALLLSQQIQAFFKESAIEFDPHTHFITLSLGIDHGEGKHLFINSKAASKEARYFGGNQIVVYDKNSKYMKEQRESLYWINILKNAFDEDKIFTYYQPIISSDNNTVKHYEVLCRLMDENNRLIDANKFIQSAKQLGFITQITKTVIDKTFKCFTENNYNFSINITMYDLHENYLERFLKYKCERYDIEPSRVHLEIVEDIIVEKTELLDKQILALKEMGFHVIIDDFGTDKSAFNRMFELQAEFIKIDGSFIKELNGDRAHKIVVKSIVEFAKRSGIKTIAEHVESKEVYDIVKELGIDYAQGYFLGKPDINL